MLTFVTRTTCGCPATLIVPASLPSTTTPQLAPAPGDTQALVWPRFSIGNTSSFIRFVSASTDAYETQPRYFFYGQDTWRITPKLTVNYGLRWEIYKPESAAGTGKGGWIDLGTGEVRIAGQDGVNLAVIPTRTTGTLRLGWESRIS